MNKLDFLVTSQLVAAQLSEGEAAPPLSVSVMLHPSLLHSGMSRCLRCHGNRRPCLEGLSGCRGGGVLAQLPWLFQLSDSGTSVQASSLFHPPFYSLVQEEVLQPPRPGNGLPAVRCHANHRYGQPAPAAVL